MHANTHKTLVTLFALAATAGFATSANAADYGVTRYDNVVVTYSDLDLRSTAGNQKLYARLNLAAERACGSATFTRDLQLRAEYRTCVESTLNKAVDQIGTRELQALHRSATARRAG
jgi:UrcA family protein